jgi:hypothetical protein
MVKKLLIAGLIIIFVMVLSYFLLLALEPYIRYQAMGGSLRHCQSKLLNLAAAMKYYAKENQGKLPLQTNWCDVFCDELSVDSTSFICPGAKNKSYSYALNKNIIGLDKIPDDVVILFDSKPGWNQVGGPELLAPENHKGKGCNILFGNFEAKFIEKKKFAELKWEVGQPKEE